MGKESLELTEPEGYDDLLRDIKQRIRTAQVRAALAVNRELVMLYWRIGRDILSRQQMEAWGTKVVGRLAADLKNTFPDMKGFSRTNLLYMRAFAEAYPNESFVQQVAGQIPWFHNCTLIDRVKDAGEREWYIRQTIENGWSRNVLALQIESGLYNRQSRAVLSPETAMLCRDRDQGWEVRAGVRRADQLLPLRRRRSASTSG